MYSRSSESIHSAAHSSPPRPSAHATMVAPFLHRRAVFLARRPLVYHHIPHRWAALDRLVHNPLQPNLRTPPVAHILRRRAARTRNRLPGSQSPAPRIPRRSPNAPRQSVRTPASQSPAPAPSPCRSQPGRRVRRPAPQHIRESLHQRVQLAIADPPNLARLALPQQRRLLPPHAQRMTVTQLWLRFSLPPVDRRDEPISPSTTSSTAQTTPAPPPPPPSTPLAPRCCAGTSPHIFQALHPGLACKLCGRRKHPVLSQ